MSVKKATKVSLTILIGTALFVVPMISMSVYAAYLGFAGHCVI